jgi:hypothetical protein
MSCLVNCVMNDIVNTNKVLAFQPVIKLVICYTVNIHELKLVNVMLVGPWCLKVPIFMLNVKYENKLIVKC